MPVTYAIDAQINALITTSTPLNSGGFTNAGDAFIRAALENAVLSKNPFFGHPGDPGVGVISSAGSFNPPWAQVIEITGALPTGATNFTPNAGEVVIVNDTIDANPWINITGAVGSVIGTVAGNETVYLSGTGNQLYVGSGNQSIANTGANTIYAGDGSDTIYGGSGDTLEGGVGNSWLLDIASSGPGSVMQGGTGDMVYWDVSHGSDTLTAGSGNDYLLGFGSDTLTGGSGHDTLVAGNGASALLVAGSGDNTLIAGTAIGKVITGGIGDDTLWDPNAAHDTLQAGSGNTFMVGTNGDSLFGAGGNDTLLADSGSVSMSGGAGNDTFGIMSNAGTESDTIDGGSGANALGFHAAGQASTDIASDGTVGAVTTIVFNSGESVQLTNISDVYFTDGYIQHIP